jgi:ACT domain-containing protein
MGPKSRKLRTGTFHEERLSQMEDNVKTVQREKQQEILDEKRTPSVEAVASISKEEDPSTMKQASRWPGAIAMVVNINRMSRKERADEIDKIIIQQGKDKEIEEILERVNSTPTGNFNNLDEALEFINQSAGIRNAGEYIRDKLEANEFLERVLSRTGSRELSRTGSTLSRTGSISPDYEFTSSLTNKEYKNGEQFGFFDHLFRFTLNKNCYIIYELKEDGSIYIELIICEPYGNLRRKNISVKGSGRVMLYDLLHFLKTNKISGYPKHNDDTNVCLTPEPSVGRAEHMDSNKLYLYYKGMGFENIEGHHYWCGKIGNIIDRIDAIVGITTPKVGTPDGLLIKLGDIAEEPGDYGGRRKHTRKKRRKTRKSNKSRKSRRRR